MQVRQALALPEPPRLRGQEQVQQGVPLQEQELAQVPQGVQPQAQARAAEVVPLPRSDSS